MTISSITPLSDHIYLAELCSGHTPSLLNYDIVAVTRVGHYPTSKCAACILCCMFWVKNSSVKLLQDFADSGS